MGTAMTEQLLDKYFEGETSLQEEAQLRTYFQRTDLPEHLQAYQPLFVYLEAEQDKVLGDDFDERVLAKLREQPVSRLRQLRPWLLRAAAAIALAIGCWWALSPTEVAPQAAGIDWSKYEVQSPEEAFKVTQVALLRASSGLQEGTTVATREVGHLKELGTYVTYSNN